MNEIHVVIGATGALGQALVLRLLAEQVPVRAAVRDIHKAKELLPEGIDIVAVDALDVTSVEAACQEAAAIYNCIYVPSSSWATLTENFLSAARSTGACLLVPTNVHPYGPLQQVPAKEDHPYGATYQRGILRMRMEKMLLDAHEAGDVRVVLPRFAAFYGPTVRDGFLQNVFQTAVAGRKSFWYGSLDVPYDLVYCDDAAMASLLLATSETAHGQVWHVPGAGPLTGRQFMTRIYEAAGKNPEIDTHTRSSLRVLGLLSPNAKALLEVMYEFENPLVMDGSKFANAFPDFAYTPHEDAIRETVDWLQQEK